MKHREMSDLLTLSLYGELDESQEFLLTEHLSACRDCRERLNQYKELHGLLDHHGENLSLDETLLEARGRLSGSLARSRSNRWSFWRRPGASPGRTEPLPYPGSAKPLWLFPTLSAGTVMLLLGIVLGSLYSGQRPLQLEMAPESRIANVRILGGGTPEEPLELVYDNVRPTRLRGTVEDPEIRRILSYAALNERNDGVRLQAVRKLDEHFANSPDEEIKMTLLDSLQNDDNPGVRRRALLALEGLPVDSEIRQALLQVLRFDPNPGLRVAAINALEGAALEGLQIDEAFIETLRERLESDENKYVRRRSEAFLREVSYR